MGKRLGLLGGVVAVMALVVGAVSPALGSSSQGAGSTAAGHADNRQTIRVIAVFTEFDPNIDVGAADLFANGAQGGGAGPGAGVGGDRRFVGAGFSDLFSSIFDSVFC